MKTKLYSIIPALFISFAAYAQTDFALEAATPMDYQVPGTKSFNVTIRNAGTGGLSSCNIFWQLDGGTISNVNKSAGSVIWGGKAGLVKDPAFKVTLAATGSHTLKVWIKTVSPVDVNPANDTFTANINVFASLPKKNVLLEVFKHQACPPCYDAANYTDTFVTKDPDYAIASIFSLSGEQLYLPDGYTINSFYNFAHPMPVFDRYKFPYQQELGTSYISGGSLTCMGDREQFYEPVQVSFKNITYNASTRELKVKLEAAFFDNLAGDYRFNLYLTEDNVKGYQADAPDPYNFIHHHVTREMLGGPWGQAGSLPSAISKNDVLTYEFTCNVNPGIKTDNMHLIAFVQTYNTDGLKRKILNSEQITFKQALSLPKTSTRLYDMQVFPNPAKGLVKISLGNDRAYRLQLADITGKVYRSEQCKGDTELNLQSLAPGNYILYADDGDMVYTKNIVKE